MQGDDADGDGGRHRVGQGKQQGGAGVAYGDNVMCGLSLLQNIMSTLNDGVNEGGGQDSTGDRQSPLQRDNTGGGGGEYSIRWEKQQGGADVADGDNVICGPSLLHNSMSALTDNGNDGGEQESTGDGQLPLLGDDTDGNGGGHIVGQGKHQGGADVAEGEDVGRVDMYDIEVCIQ